MSSDLPNNVVRQMAVARPWVVTEHYYGLIEVGAMVVVRAVSEELCSRYGTEYLRRGHADIRINLPEWPLSPRMFGGRY